MATVVFLSGLIAWTVICAAIGFFAGSYHELRRQYIRNMPSIVAPR